MLTRTRADAKKLLHFRQSSRLPGTGSAGGGSGGSNTGVYAGAGLAAAVLAAGIWLVSSKVRILCHSTTRPCMMPWAFVKPSHHVRPKPKDTVVGMRVYLRSPAQASGEQGQSRAKRATVGIGGPCFPT